MLPAFRLARPQRLDDALELLSDDQMPYCGGTELLMAMKLGLLAPECLVDLKRVPELRGTNVRDGRLRIGASTTHADLAVTAALAQCLPLFVTVERSVGNPRVRAQGSIGGNCCFAEPRSDVTTLLAALGAKLVLVSAARGQRELEIGEFLVGAYETARAPDELLKEVIVPLRSGVRGTHIKQQHNERPIVSVVLVLDGPDGACTLSVGAVGDVPLVRHVSSPAEIDPEAIADEVDPSPDLGGSVAYKRHLTAVVVRRALAEVGERRAS